jgi:VWA domain-containing protein
MRSLAARAFLKGLGPNDQVTVVAFNDTAFTLAPRDHARGRLQAIDKLTAWGGTAVYDVIVRLVGQLSRQAGRRTFVVFTDGEDQNSQASLQDVARAISDSDTTFFAVGLGKGERLRVIKTNLEPLAEASGGLALFAEHQRQAARAVCDDRVRPGQSVHAGLRTPPRRQVARAHRAGARPRRARSRAARLRRSVPIAATRVPRANTHADRDPDNSRRRC